MEERNYAHFLNLFLSHFEQVSETFAYCLMRNHFHFLIRVKSEAEIKAISNSGAKKANTPSQNFSNFLNAYAKAINKAYDRTGSLFQHPFGRVVIEQNAHLFRVVIYIHQNPQRHGFVDDFRTWPYSSYDALLKSDKTFLQREEVLEWFSGLAGFEEVHNTKIPASFARELAPDD